VTIGENQRMVDLTYNQAAALGYERAFGRVSSHFIPFLLDAAQVAAGQQVLDIATGTGLAAEAALALVGPAGHVTAADLSPGMIAGARLRLGDAVNVSIAVEDGQALSFPNASFDTVLCSMGLMFFPDPSRGLAEFRRVLRPGGFAAVSVNTVPERSYNTRVYCIIARYEPSFVPAALRVFALGDATRLRGLFEAAGFRDVVMMTRSHCFEVRLSPATSSNSSKVGAQPDRPSYRCPRKHAARSART
jgi:ubiquinone/menaquinone biosynthesis C-methylase UbiE